MGVVSAVVVLVFVVRRCCLSLVVGSSLWLVVCCL